MRWQPTAAGMEFGAATYLLGYAAGALSTLSPCVLPLLPILLATAASRHRRGPLALGLGLTLSFTAAGIFVATIGMAIGLDGDVLRRAAALLLTLFGVVLLSPALQRRLASLTSGFARPGDAWLARLSGDGWAGQFAVGLVLGVVWSPCVGPTLGAAGALAAQGSQLGEVALLMLVFGLGAATPLVAVGTLSREASARLQGRLQGIGARGRQVLGIALLAIGLVVLTGRDRRIEAWAVAHSPDWLTELTTRY